jgi:hypothetical protein
MEPISGLLDKKSLVDRIVKTFEIISLVLITIPYCFIVLSMLLSSVPGKDYFILFPYGLVAIFPTGILALIVQILGRLRKQPISKLSEFALNASKVTIVFGIFAYMLIYSVVGE